MLGPDATAAEVLRAAAEVLRARGWHQGDWCSSDDGKGAPCLAGAICVALSGTPFLPSGNWFRHLGWLRFQGAMRTLSDGLGLPHPTDMFSWNDVPGRTVEEVLAALEAAAVAAEGRERGEATGDSSGQGPDHG